METEDLLISRLNLYRNKYCLLVGAGVSTCAGVPLATKDLPGLPSIVSNIRRDFYKSLGYPDLSEAQLLSWYSDQKLLQQSETIYSDALNLIGDTQRARQHYLRKFFENKKPGVCHESIAKLMEYEQLEVIFTANFDSLLEDAIRNNGKCGAPKVASHSLTINDILLTEPGPKVIKLHGDYLFSDMRNTEQETQKLTENMRNKLRSILGERGLIVIGYAGNDMSIMSIFEKMIYDGSYFPYGLFWLHLDGHSPGDRVKQLLERAEGQLLSISGAEFCLAELSRRLGNVKN